MKNKKLLGPIVLVAILAIVCAVNIILSALSARVDLTAERLYTLSDGSKAILTNLNETVTLKLYFSESAKHLPPSIKTYAKRVRDLLNEYKLAGDGKIVLEFYDPKPDSDEEEWAKKAGLDKTPTEPGNPQSETIYFGLVAACGTNENIVASFDSEREASLEYDITRSITRVVWPRKPVVGVLSGIPGVLREQMNPMMMQTGKRPSEGWYAFNELAKDYDVRPIDKDSVKNIAFDDESGDSDSSKLKLKLLVVVHPKDLDEDALFAIDQFVIKGGRLIVCVDPYSPIDFFSNIKNQWELLEKLKNPAASSTLGKLFTAWGVTFDTTNCVADSRATLSTEIKDPALLKLEANNLDQKNILSTGVSEMILPYAGSIECQPPEGLTFNPLVFTTDSTASLVSSAAAATNSLALIGALPQIHIPANEVGRQLAFAGMLSGTFRTAFPNGPNRTDGSTNAIPNVQETGSKGNVFIFSDSDFLSDNFSVKAVRKWKQVDSMMGGDLGPQYVPVVVTVPRNGNIPLFYNIVERFAGRDELIGLRSRGRSDRPFTVVRELQAKADKKVAEKVEEYKNEKKKIGETIAKIQEKLIELLQNAEIDQHGRFLLSKESVSKYTQDQENAKREIKENEKKLEEIEKQSRKINRERTVDVENLGFRVKMLNICWVPLMVILVGVGYALLRKAKSRAFQPIEQAPSTPLPLPDNQPQPAQSSTNGEEHTTDVQSN